MSETANAPAGCNPISRQLISLPLTAPSAAARRLIESSDRTLRFVPTKDALFTFLENCDRGELSSLLAPLAHRLSSYMNPSGLDPHTVIASERDEASHYSTWLRTTGSTLCADALQSLNAAMTGGSGTIRRAPMVLASRDRAILIPMVDWRLGAARMAELVGLLNGGELGSGVLAGVRALVVTNNAHAFQDGNGRLGRALFNYCLHRQGMSPDSYVPLKTLGVLAQGGYEIRLREAELFGDWDGVVAYHCAALQLITGMSRPQLAAASNHEAENV